MVQLFIEHGAEVNTKYNDTHYAMSPLHYAAIGGKWHNCCVSRGKNCHTVFLSDG